MLFKIMKMVDSSIRFQISAGRGAAICTFPHFPMQIPARQLQRSTTNESEPGFGACWTTSCEESNL